MKIHDSFIEHLRSCARSRPELRSSEALEFQYNVPYEYKENKVYFQLNHIS